MGLVLANVTLSNPVIGDLKPIEVTGLVDTGATYLYIPEHIASQFQLKELQKREVTLANGQTIMVPYVGPVKMQFEKRICFVGAMVLGDQMLIGAIPMEDMDLIVHPKLLRLAVNPDSPNIAHGLAK